MEPTASASKILVICACGTRLRAPMEAAGKRVKCPKCGIGVPVPAAQPRAPRPVVVAAPEPERPPARTGLDGLSPDYRIRLGRWIELAKPHLRAVLGPSIGYFALFLPIFAIVAFLMMAPAAMMLDPSSGGPDKLLGLLLLPVGLAVNTILMPAFAVGFHIVSQAQLKGKPWNFGTFFAGFRKIWPLAGCAGIILLIYTGPLLLNLGGKLFWKQPPAEAAGIMAGLGLAGSLLAGYVILRLVVFPHYLIIDRDCGAIEALRGSWRLSSGHFWGLLGTLLLLTITSALFSAITLGLGIVVAVPFGVLVINAGYLLVAGSEPLPGEERDAELIAPSRRLPAWLSASAAAVVLLAAGAGMGWLAYSEQDKENTALALRKQRHEEARAKYEAESRDRLIRERKDAEQHAREMLAYFREGGLWSMKIIDRDAGPEAGPAGGAGAGGTMGGGPGGPNGPGGGRSEERPVPVLVMGPPGLLKDRPAVHFGKPSSSKSVDDALKQRLEDLAFSTREYKRLLVQQFADALATGDVEAVRVEVKRPPIERSGAGGGAGSAGPDGQSGGAAGPGGPSGAGGEAYRDPLLGISVPLDKAVPVTREQFLKLFDDRSEEFRK